MSILETILNEKFPMPVKGDILEELKQERLRSAFVSGMYWALGRFIDLIPTENKNAEAGYNIALDEVMGNLSTFTESLK